MTHPLAAGAFISAIVVADLSEQSATLAQQAKDHSDYTAQLFARFTRDTTQPITLVDLGTCSIAEQTPTNTTSQSSPPVQEEKTNTQSRNSNHYQPNKHCTGATFKGIWRANLRANRQCLH